jgi:hypothetical protein
VTFRRESAKHRFLLAFGQISTNGHLGPVDRDECVYVSLKTHKFMITTHLHEPGKASRRYLITPMKWGSEPSKSEVLPLLRPACRRIVIMHFCVLSEIYTHSSLSTGLRWPFVEV